MKIIFFLLSLSLGFFAIADQSAELKLSVPIQNLLDTDCENVSYLSDCLSEEQKIVLIKALFPLFDPFCQGSACLSFKEKIEFFRSAEKALAKEEKPPVDHTIQDKN